MAAAALLGGCSAGSVSVHPPTPSGAVAQQCAHLGNALPQQLDSLRTRVINPQSPLVHAWGNPAVILTCGVGPPAGYSATSSELTAVDHVNWFQQLPDSKTVIWTALRPGAANGQNVNVELEVPTHYQDQGTFLADLAQPIKTALP